MVNHPVLKYFDCSAEVTLQCDASEKGLGAVLLQNGQPVAFASKTLTYREKVRPNRKGVSCDSVCLSEVQPVPLSTRKDHSTVRPQTSPSNLQEIRVSSAMQIAKDATLPTTVPSGCHIQTRFEDVHSGPSVKGLPRQCRRGRQGVPSLCTGD